jgi:RNA polymerase sigma factor (sigma-70 family)
MDRGPFPASDAELVVRFVRERSDEAFRVLVERHSGMVHSACARGLGPRAALADDAAQAVFIVLARKARSIRNPGAVGGWLFHISRTVVANLLREEERRRKREEAAGRQGRSRPVEDRDRTWDLALPYLDEGIASLPGAQRDAVVLHYLEGLPQEEAARRLGCAQSTLHERISTALGRLKRFFTGKGVALSAAAVAAGLSGLAAPAAPAAVASACAAAGAGGAMASVSGGAASLAQGALKALFVAKVKAAVAVVVCVTAAAAGGGAAVRAFVAPDMTAPAAERPAPVAEARPDPAPPAPPPLPAGPEVVLEQIISREDSRFSCPHASLNVGRDGLVYLSSGGNDSYVLRIGRDGKGKYGQPIVYAAKNAAANADGVVVSANGHFAHKVTIYDRQLHQTAEVADFLVNDQVGWDAPSEVEAGAGGDFYGLDQHRDRILRINPAGKVVQAFAIPREPAAPQGQMENLRVCEPKQVFYILARGGGIRCVGFDGKTRWSKGFSLAGQWNIGSRAFDCDDEGTLHVLENGSDTVRKFGLDGRPAGELKLQIGDRKPPPGKLWFFALRVSRGDVLVRGEHPTELFQVYAAATGAFKNAVHVDHERLAARFPGEVWTAGRAHPFKIEFQAAGGNAAPRWRLWMRPLDVPEYRELKLANDQAEIPPEASGLYRIKLTPEVQPWERGLSAQVASEYQLQTVVEIRPAEAGGSVSVWTPGSRACYGQGEPVPFVAAARGAEKDRDVPATLKLLDGTRAVAEVRATLKTGAPPQSFALPPALTLGLRQGRYTLAAEAPGFTCASQPIVVGPPVRDPPYFITQYGDYGFTFPMNATFWNSADAVAAHAARLDKLRINLMVDRIGWPAFNPFSWENSSNSILDALGKRLAADPLAVSPDRARLDVPFLQCLGAYGARGIRHMGILMAMDAGLPLGSGFDNRKPDQLVEGIRKHTEAVRPYGAYRGWTWSSNWWVFDKRGAAAAKTPAEKSAFEAAIRKARETGAWDPVLDQVAAHRLGMAVEAQDLFNQTLRKVAPDAGYRTAVAAPYRNVESYPPVTFSNVDEVDLHIQWEQMAVPYHGPHNVDFYSRPGKRGWAHPEIWNDDGTGGQVLSVLFQIAMRGADGVGFSGDLPPWAGHGGGLPDDPRMAHYGHASVTRALNTLFRAYGPLFAATENDDRVAIAASGRMYRIDDWSHVTGHHFARQMEAYISCLHAHHPASIVFAEDLKADTLKKFKAVLLVDERVELEPGLLAALRAAKAAGTAVLYDKTCRESVVKEFAPLDVAFDKLDRDRSPAGDDAAYWRFSGYGTANAPEIRRALDPVTPPAAGVDDPEILITQRKAEGARYLWVVNNTLPRLDPGQLWRVNLAVTTRVPVVAPVRLAADAPAIYDVFAMKQVAPAGGTLTADLRSLPARLYALLPAPIARVEVRAPRSVPAGAPFRWQAAAQDAAGRPVAALVPFRIRLLASDGRVLAEEFAAGGSKGAGDTLTAPFNAPGPLVLEATELFGGRMARASIEAAPAPAPAIAAGPAPSAAPPAPAEASVRTAGQAAGDFPAADLTFGPHLRDLVVADGGKTAVMNAMNWDHNLYAVDTETGRLRWRQRAGHYFAFAPQALANGVAVQGFDFKTAEGYHLYLVGGDGKAERRFALYGVPKRLPFRFVPGIGCEDRQGLGGRINNFACPPDASWVASAGDLGLAVWSRDGRLRWSQDWWKNGRHVAALAAPDAETLLAVEGMKARFLNVLDGKPKGELTLGTSGEVRRIVFGGPAAAILTTTEGGRVTVLRGGRIERVIPTPCEDAGLSSDGGLLAVTTGNQIKLYSIARGLQWTFSGDDRVRFPRFSPDGRRIAITSDLGSVFVLDTEGKTLWEEDLGARAVPAWLPGGDLLLAGWMGRVLRIGLDYKVRWVTRLQPEAPDMRERLLTDDGAPTARIAGWGTAEAAPLPLEPSLVAKIPLIARFVPSAGWGGEAQFSQDPKALFDGRPDAPPKPWIDWSYVGFFAETSPVNYVLIDAFRKQLRVSAVTFVEDAAHPESWLRDARFEYWDAAAEKWTLAADILADAPVHTHKLPKPVEAARFRILLPWGAVGNLRLGEIAFHGEALGCPHPDAAAKKASAVLFDEQDDLKRDLIWGGNGLSFKLDAAYSGGRCLSLAGNRKVAPLYQPPFGHFIANWDFEIVEKPQPGQYRWLQFAWKAASGKTRGLTLGVGGEGAPNTGFHAGEPVEVWPGAAARKVADAPPADWKVERVDLWEAFGKKPGRVQALFLGAAGDGALFDQIALGRSPQDLPPPRAPGR